MQVTIKTSDISVYINKESNGGAVMLVNNHKKTHPAAMYPDFKTVITTTIVILGDQISEVEIPDMPDGKILTFTSQQGIYVAKDDGIEIKANSSDELTRILNYIL